MSTEKFGHRPEEVTGSLSWCRWVASGFWDLPPRALWSPGSGYNQKVEELIIHNSYHLVIEQFAMESPFCFYR
jgi:hypothetical protein